MFEKILVPLDGSTLSEQIVPFVLPIASGFKSSVLLAHIIDTTAVNYADQVDASAVSTLVDEEQRRAQAYLDKVKARFAAAGIAANTQVIVGSPVVQEIAELAASSGSSLIAMSTHGRSGVARWVIGSVTDRLLDSTEVPLLAVRPKENSPDSVTLGTVLLPLDGSGLAEQAIPYAEELARTLKLKVQLVRVVPTTAFAFAEPYPEGIAEPAVDLLQIVEDEARSYLDQQAKRLQSAGFTVDAMVVLGDAGVHLVDIAASRPDMITVMSTHGRSGLGRVLLGSVADKVVRSAGNPVMVIRAKD